MRTVRKKASTLRKLLEARGVAVRRPTRKPKRAQRPKRLPEGQKLRRIARIKIRPWFSVELFIDLEGESAIVSEANRSRPEHWTSKSRRAELQRDTVGRRLILAFGRLDPEPGTTILLTRIGQRPLDPDNLGASLKHVQDGVADALGIDDGDARFSWSYEQELRRRAPGVRIHIAQPFKPSGTHDGSRCA